MKEHDGETPNKGGYEPTLAELAGIDRGLRDAEQGRFATEGEVEAAFAKFRGAQSFHHRTCPGDPA